MTTSWQYGCRIENIDIQVREITVKQGNQTARLVLKKEKGKYHEVGDSRDSGDVHSCTANFSAFGEKDTFVSTDLDLTDINAIRYYFRNDKSIAYFLDKFVIVTTQERKAYKGYAKPRIEILEKQREQERKQVEETKLKEKKIEDDIYQKKIQEKIWNSKITGKQT